jgi:hypothetical protein
MYDDEVEKGVASSVIDSGCKVGALKRIKAYDSTDRH